DINQLRMVRHVAVVRLGRIVVLDQVIPDTPLPYDFAGGPSCRFDLDDGVGEEVVAYRAGPASRGDGFVGGLLVPHDHEYVAVRELRDVVMGKLRIAEEPEVPNKLAVPRELLNAAAVSPASAEGQRFVAKRARSQQVAVVQQVSAQRGSAI